MNYLTVKEAAKKLNVSERRIQYYCANGLIPNCACIGKQWLIPDDVAAPPDRRYKAGKTEKATERYHFPIFVYSELYSRADLLLDDDEKKVLALQESHLRGEYEKTINDGFALLAEMNEEYLRVGILACLGYVALIHGAVMEFDFAYNAIKKIAESESKHQEDYKLIFAMLDYHLKRKESFLFNIDASRLSRESFVYLNHMRAIRYVLSNENFNPFYLSCLEVSIIEAESQGTSAYFVSEGILISSVYYKNDNVEKGDEYLKKAVKIARDKRLFGELSKYFWMVSSAMERLFQKEFPDMISQLQKKAKSNYENYWRMVEAHGKRPALFATRIEYFEIGLLLSYGFSDTKIAKILLVPRKEIANKVSSICKEYGFANRQELIKNIKEDYISG